MRSVALRFTVLLVVMAACTPAGDGARTENPDRAEQSPGERLERATESSDGADTLPFELTAPPGWTKTRLPLGFRLTSNDGQMIVNTSGPFPLSELEAQRSLIDQQLGALSWTRETLPNGDFVAANLNSETEGTRLGFFMTPSAHVFVSLDAPAAVGEAEEDLLRAIAASIEVRRIVTPDEATAQATACPDNVVEAAHAQGLCLDPAAFGAARVEACMRHFEAEGIARAPAVEAGILEDSGQKVVCWEAPSMRTAE